MGIVLPMCRWRRQPVGPDRHVCISPKIRCNAHGIPDEFCLTCRYVNHPEDPPLRRQCKHFGELVNVQPIRLLNRTDGAAVLSRRHKCEIHGICTPNVVGAEHPCCITCPQHSSNWVRELVGSVRHLTYYLYPVGPLWRWNVEQLCARMQLFNGARLVGVGLGQGTATLEEVKAAFGSHPVDFLPFANDPTQKEMVAHQPMVERISQYRAEGDVTFYGHGKGVTSVSYGDGPRRWAEAMYRGLLDYWPAVRDQLREHATVGIFRRIMSPAPAAHVPWHYSGSFRWVRNMDLYQRQWRMIDPNFYGPETYPGRHFTKEESSCLYGEFAFGGVGLYLESTWAEWAQAACDEWYMAHQGELLRPRLLTCILTAHSQPELVHQAIRSVQEQTSDSWQLLIVHSGACASADRFSPYRGDGRIHLMPTGETPADSAGRCGQGWAINQAWRLGLVRGELVTHLSDDDVYQPGCFEAWIRWAEAHPQEEAWYGMADRGRVHPGGFFELLGPMGLRGPGTPGNSLRGHVDGLQVCVRRSRFVPWTEAKAEAHQADGVWMDALSAATPIHPAEVYVGTHRHCPSSNFTR